MVGCGGYAIGIYWVETRDAATRPTMHRKNPGATKNYLAQKINSAEGETPLASCHTKGLYCQPPLLPESPVTHICATDSHVTAGKIHVLTCLPNYIVSTLVFSLFILELAQRICSILD